MTSEDYHNEGNQISKITPMLENKIELMLDKIMDEDDGNQDKLRFSYEEDEDDNENISTPSHEQNVANSIYNPIFCLNYSTTSEDFEKNKPQKYKRINKKYPTVSFNPISSFVFSSTNLGNTYSNLHPDLFNPNNSQTVNFNNQQKPLNLPKNSNGTGISICSNTTFGTNTSMQMSMRKFERSDKRKTTYEMAKSKFNVRNSNPSRNILDSNNNINNINKGFSLREGNLRKSKKISTYKYMKTPPLASPLNSQDKPKKFGTAIFSQKTDIKIEMLIYELTNALEKAEKIDYYCFGKLQGNFINVIKTHKGSRIFQNYLKNTHSDIIHQIFSEISPFLPEILSDSYSNYFCQRFFIYLNQKDRISFLVAIRESIKSLSMNSIGTYPIQGIIEQVGSKFEKRIIMNALQDSIPELSFNTYGTHVLEKIIACFEEEFSNVIFEYIIKNFIPLANNINGICVIKKVTGLTHKRTLHEKIKEIANENALSLIQHPHGNHVIQIILENWDNTEIKLITKNFENNYAFLSMQKYSSNVVEKIIEKEEEYLTQFIKEIEVNDQVAEIMKSNFGNYVIQKALKLSKGKNCEVLSEIVNRNIYKLNDKKLIVKWKSIVAPYL